MIRALARVKFRDKGQGKDMFRMRTRGRLRLGKEMQKRLEVKKQENRVRKEDLV